MGESKDIQIQQQIADDQERQTEEPWNEDRRITIVSLGHPAGCECATCMTEYKRTHYDPDHLNPEKGGNKASDDYW